MFQPPTGGAHVPPYFALPTFNDEVLRHVLIGDRASLIEAINRMAVLGYCERIAWSEPLPTGRSGEYISVMSRRRMTP